MGAPMAGHLARAGYTLTVHDIDRAKADSVSALCEGVSALCEGVRVADRPSAVAKASDIVITMLPSGAYVRDVALGEGGLIEGFQPGALLLDTSSAEPWLTVETAAALAARGVDMVDAPVSGAQVGARTAELVFMVGGAAEAVARVSPLLEVMGTRVFHLGPIGAGHAMKCINNLITAQTFMATAEGLTLGTRFGLDPGLMTDVLNVSTGMSWISQTHIKQRIISRTFDDPFKLGLMAKDVGIALELARRDGLTLPLAALAGNLWQAAENYADQGAGISHMVRWLEHTTGTQIASSGAPQPNAGS